MLLALSSLGPNAGIKPTPLVAFGLNDLLGPIPGHPRMRLDSRNLPGGEKPPNIERVLGRRKPHVPRTLASLNILKDHEAATEYARAPPRLVA